MTTKSTTTPKRKSKTRKLMIRNIKAYNNVFTDADLEKKSDVELLNNCHPLDRIDFARILLLCKRISEEEFRKYKSNY